MKIAICQHDAGRVPFAARLEWMAREVALAARAGAELVLLPELYASGYNVGSALRDRAEPREGRFARKAADIARDAGCAVAFGYPERDGDRIYNAAQVIGRDGRCLAHHRKTILPPGIEGDHFATGDTLCRFDLNGVRCAILICYEAEFPEMVRDAACDGVQVILVPTANGWPVVPDHLMPARAFESGVFMAYANIAGSENGMAFAGLSCICDPWGRTLARAGAGSECIMADLDPGQVAAARTRLPYVSDCKRLVRG